MSRGRLIDPIETMTQELGHSVFVALGSSKPALELKSTNMVI